MAKHVLLPMQSRTADETVEGAAFPTIGRTKWTAKLRIGHIAEGGGVTIVLDGSPDGDDSTWVQIAAFGAQSAVGEFRLDSGEDGSVEVTLTTYMRFLRARRTAQTGDAVYEVIVDAPFLSPDDGDLEVLLGKRAREYSQGLPRLVQQAESDVLELLRVDPATGALEVDDSPLLFDSIRRAIALQVEHLLEIDRLRKSNDASAKATLRMLGRYGDGVRGPVRGFIAAADMTWRHR